MIVSSGKRARIQSSRLKGLTYKNIKNTGIKL